LSFMMVFWKFYTHKKKYFIVFLTLIVLISFAESTYYNQDLKITFLDVKHGDLCLIETKSRVILIDTGDGKLKVNDILRSRGIHRVDLLIWTHAHADHIGGVSDLLDTISVDKIMLNQSTADALLIENSSLMNRLTVITKSLNYNIKVSSNSNVEIGIHPLQGPHYKDDLNEDALLCTLTFGNFSGVFLADISRDMIMENENLIQSSAIDGQLEFIKSSHHGSKTGNATEFYKNQNQAFVITSCGTKFNMPHISLEETLNKQARKHLTTYKNGEIQLLIHHHQIDIKTYLEANYGL